MSCPKCGCKERGSVADGSADVEVCMHCGWIFGSSRPPKRAAAPMPIRPEPAFPGVGYDRWTGNFRAVPDTGMSLRDYFAAKAMAAMVAGDGARMVADRDQRYDETNWAEIVANNAYAFADAMLAERAKGKSP